MYAQTQFSRGAYNTLWQGTYRCSCTGARGKRLFACVQETGNVISAKIHHTEPPFMLYMSGHFESRGSAVGIATAYGLDDRRVGVRVPVG
jgi:hypothetical protein